MLREKLEALPTDSLREAWREADALEKQGLTTQQVAETLRNRLGADAALLERLADATRKRAAGLDGALTSSQKKKPVSPLRRGFLQSQQQKKRPAVGGTTRTPPPRSEEPGVDVAPSAGPPVDEATVDFMLEIHRLRSSGAEDDETLRRRVLAHVQRRGAAFLSHMTACAALTDELTRRLSDDHDAVRARVFAHYRRRPPPPKTLD